MRNHDALQVINLQIFYIVLKCLSWSSNFNLLSIPYVIRPLALINSKKTTLLKLSLAIYVDCRQLQNLPLLRSILRYSDILIVTWGFNKVIYIFVLQLLKTDKNCCITLAFFNSVRDKGVTSSEFLQCFRIQIRVLPIASRIKKMLIYFILNIHYIQIISKD